MEALGHERKARRDARTYSEPGFQFTRRTIALAVVLSVVVVPILAGWISPVSISYGWHETTSGFMFFTEGRDMVKWAVGSGIIITPVYTHLLYAISGMYFGSSSVK
jgi:hypothetical protein